MKKNIYSEEIHELQFIAASRRQHTFAPKGFLKTKIGQLFNANWKWLSDNSNPTLLLTTLVNILTVLGGSKPKLIKAYLIGKQVIELVFKLKKNTKEFVRKINKYFEPSEFFDRRMLRYFKENGIDVVEAVNPNLVAVLTYIRQNTGRAVMINNWKWGGRLSQRGYRGASSKVGSIRSQHRKKINVTGILRYGNAIDFNVMGMTTKEVHNFILHHSKDLYKLGLRRVEKSEYTPSWIHIDLKIGHSKIYFFAP